MPSDDEMGDASADTARMAAPPKRRQRVKTSTPQQAARTLGLKCFICEADISDAVPETYFGEVVHGKCFLAARARRRVVAGTPQASIDKANFRKRPDTWRSEHMPFISEQSRRLAVLDLKEKVMKTRTTKTFSKKATVNQNFWLAKPRFAAHIDFGEKWTPEQADAECDRRHEKSPLRR